MEPPTVNDRLPRAVVPTSRPVEELPEVEALPRAVALADEPMEELQRWKHHSGWRGLRMTR